MLKDVSGGIWCAQDGEWRSYDAVLIAGPLELANIGIGGFRHEKPPLRQFQRTVTTLVQGRLRPSYFGVHELPQGICALPLLTCHAVSPLALSCKGECRASGM